MSAASVFHKLTLKSVHDETADARSFVFVPPRGSEDFYRYKSGQFLTFRIPHEGGVIERSYSFSSARCCDPDLTICVKRVPDGRGSNWMHDRLQVGAKIEATEPAGRFVLRDGEQPVFLLAGGSGITPCLSLIKTLLFETDRTAKLVYANRDAASIIYRSALDELAARFPKRLVVDHWCDDISGFMKAADIVDTISGWETADIYICGPAPLMELAEETLDRACGKTARIFIERFISPDDDGAEKPSSPVELNAAPIDRFRLTLDGEDHDVAIGSGQTLLEAAIAAGVDAPHSCTEGHCGACMAILKSGEVTMASTRALSKRNIERGYVLACQSRPSSPEALWLDFDA